MKARKKTVTYNISESTENLLKNFCDNSGTWNKSIFVDLAIQEKLKREKVKTNEH